MKKKIILIQFFVSLVFLNVRGQDKTELKDLKVPVSPAFSILDFSPKTIETPGTIKAFTANLVSMVAKEAGLPKNFAFEFAPYWFFKHPNMDIYKYHGLIVNDAGSASDFLAPQDSMEVKEVFKLKQNIFYGLRSTNLSFGSVFKDSSKALPVDVNYIAYAFRANIINLRNKNALIKLRESIVAVNQSLQNEQRKAIAKCKDLTGMDRINCIGEAITKTKDSVFKMTRADFMKYLMIRPIFSMDIAFASSTAFADNNFSNSKSYRTGGWITLAYNQPLVSSKKVKEDIENLIECKNYLNAYFLFRLLKENKTKDFKAFVKQDLVDLGGRLEFEFNKFSFSVESIKRINNKDKNLNTSRTVGIIQYKIAKDLLLLGTFGKDFGDINNLVTLFGINWGFGENELNTPFKK